MGETIIVRREKTFKRMDAFFYGLFRLSLCGFKLTEMTLRQIGTCKEHLLDGISVSSHLKEHVLQSAGEDRDHVKATTLVHDGETKNCFPFEFNVRSQGFGLGRCWHVRYCLSQASS